MRNYLILMVVALFAFQTYAQKTLATHSVGTGVSGFLTDGKGNIAELTFATVSGKVTSASVEVKNKKGTLYASGNVTEVIGADGAAVKAFYKKYLIITGVEGTTNIHYSYKLSKKGLELAGTLVVPWATQFLNVFGNVLILRTISGTDFTFDQYGLDLKKGKKGVTGKDDIFPRVVDFRKGTTQFTVGVSNRTVTVIKP